ncbi:MAG: HPr kinase/phosphorylase [Amphiplicatus sp.]
MERPLQIHGVAAALALDPDGPLVGALFLGAAGSGKSALVLSLVETCPWRRSALVADDVVLLAARERAVFARPPGALAGLIEARGFGPVRVRTVPEARLLAAFDLALRAERAPAPRIKEWSAALRLPVWPLAPDEGALAGGAGRLRGILRAIVSGQTA